MSSFDWKVITYGTLAVTRYFGAFLQDYELAEPLLWSNITEAGEAASRYHKAKRRGITAVLLRLGHRLTEIGKLESYQAYLLRRSAFLPIKKAPEKFQALLIEYSSALTQRRIALSTITYSNRDLARFLTWCQQEGIHSLTEIQSHHIKAYIISIGWQNQCSKCHNVSTIASSTTTSTCAVCMKSGCVRRCRRLSAHTLRANNSTLKMFFAWLKRNRMIMAQPVIKALPMPDWYYRHYSKEIIGQLCQFMSNPASDPEEALCLYLILFHALSVWELRHVMIPTTKAMPKLSVRSQLTNAYYLIIPRRTTTRGRQNTGRGSERLNFLETAQTWLRPLLDRLQEKRIQRLRCPQNNFLYVSQYTARYVHSVNHHYIENLVKSASLRACGIVCSPSILRTTSALGLCDQFDPQVLTGIGWNPQTATGYAYRDRELVHPQSEKPISN